jgi:DNA-binding LytR/AlgR family response regulator
MRITAIIVDDEPVLCENLRNMLAEQWPELSIIATAGDGNKAMQLALKLRPDIAFLDIRMPERTGLETASKIGDFCRIIFVTAYDEYAIEAFEKQAVDYLLKPITAERLAKTVARLKKDLRKNNILPTTLLEELLHKRNGVIPSPSYLQWVKAGSGDRVRLISVDDVCYFQSEDKYTKVVTSSGEELIRTSIKQLAESLNPEQFWRIHRATIVKVSNIKHATRSYSGRYRIELNSHDTILTSSRTYAYRFKQM